jgi:hypothetical protein
MNRIWRPLERALGKPLRIAGFLERLEGDDGSPTVMF